MGDLPDLQSFDQELSADRGIGEIELPPDSEAPLLVVERDWVAGWIESDWVRRAQRLGLWELVAGDLVLESPIPIDADAVAEQAACRMQQSGSSALMLTGPDRQVSGLLRRSTLTTGTESVSLENLKAGSRRLLEQAGEIAAERGRELWLVGGLVRDLLRGQSGEDLDLVTDGPVAALAKVLAARFDGTPRIHGRFETAGIDLPDGTHLDLAMSRTELYRFPGALPEVQPATLERDLLRRDFAVNSMAVSLNPDRFGQLQDPFGGRDDLARGRLRIHHPLSFVEDPTRLFRAARIQHRLGLRLSPGSGRLARKACAQGWIDRLSRPRLLREWRLVFEESDWTGMIRSLDRCGVLDSLASGLGSSGLDWSLLADAELMDREYRASRGRGARFPPFHLGWILLLRGAGGRATFIRRRLALGTPFDRDFARVPALAQELVDRLGDPTRQSPRRIHETCRNESDLSLIAAAVVCGQHHVRRAVSAYFDRWSRIAPRITGDDLKRQGIATGPEIGEALRRALHSRLDDPSLSVEEELQHALGRKPPLDKH